MTRARIAASVLAAILVGILAACAETVYAPYDAPADTANPLAREVRYEVAKAFYADPPGCVTILPVEVSPEFAVAETIEETLARHLAGRVPRVIGPAERRRHERTAGIDLANAGDWRAFAATTRCRFFLKTAMDQFGNDYFVVWSGRMVGLSLELLPASGEEALWRATHVASRGDGGVPLSPFSLVAGVFNAGRFRSDADILPSIIDDAARRMMVTFPDVR